jgi:hypothetical protein
MNCSHITASLITALNGGAEVVCDKILLLQSQHFHVKQ